MAEPQPNVSEQRRCAQCGVPLPRDLPPDLCPKCLLRVALAPADKTQKSPQVFASHPRPPGLPQPGEQLGHYTIARLLGGGGMGAVFEAEDLESGRRVALKVLGHALDSPEGRERFLREGRLAASINHPNSVYVFGTEEIGGTPVIAMELVVGGTLEERVRARGPLAPAEAVDAVLQITAGLEAAQKAGILHRDVKPSNCFVDAEGTVKIGDFGLSISTALRTEPALTTSGSFLGTPAFCSPEQLRGEELTSRSDIYSLGATLFYLLTGRTPFEAKNFVALIALVLENPAPSPQQLRPEVSRGLAKVVQRCLEKPAGERYKNYSDLRQALAPYSSAAPVPAMLGVRFAAGAIDMAFISLISLAVMVTTSVDLTELMNQSTRHPWRWLGYIAAGLCSSVLYYALLEGRWGATLGKAICRLRVIGPQKIAPGVGRALVRALVYVGTPVLPVWALYGANPGSWILTSIGTLSVGTACFYVIWALLFSTARRRNGYAALQDLASDTRVIFRLALQVRPVLSTSEAPPAGIDHRPRIGPYHVLETLEESSAGTWLLGYDLRLLRKVWIHGVPAGTPPVAPLLRNLGRVGRLRWLAGRRSLEENWDAFEAVTGKPLPDLLHDRQPWSHVRFWLMDLARETTAAEKDGTLPRVLALDRVWITGEGRAKLLDFRAPRTTRSSKAAPLDEAPASPAPDAVQRFLGEIAHAALAGRAAPAVRQAEDLQVPLPLHARDFLQKLPALRSAADVAAALQPLFQRPPAVTRARRAVLLAGCLGLPVLACLAALFSFSLLERWEVRYPGLLQLNLLLRDRWTRNLIGKPASGPTDRQLAVYIATHYAPLLTNQQTWNSVVAFSLIKGESRTFAEQSLLATAAPTPEEIKDAETVVGSRLPKPDLPALRKRPMFPLIIFTGTLAFYVCVPAVLAALLFRGGLLVFSTGVAFVKRNGTQASRLRLLWRSVVAWAPVWIAFALATAHLERPLTWEAAAALALVCSVALLSLALPQRGVPDYLAGTWPVPR